MASTYRYAIEIMPLVNDDLNSIAEYIINELQAPDSATELLKKIKAAMMTLNEYPYRTPLLREPILARKGYRALLVDEYMIFYLIHEPSKTVRVMRALYAKRDYKNQL